MRLSLALSIDLHKIVQESVSDAYSRYCNDFLKNRCYPAATLVSYDSQKRYLFFAFYYGFFKNKVLLVDEVDNDKSPFTHIIDSTSFHVNQACNPVIYIFNIPTTIQ